MPTALHAFDHFLLWDWELRQGRDGPIWTKPPLKVTGKGHAKSTDAGGWGSFRSVVNACRLRKLPGFGFALTEDDPFCFGDLDDCRDPETGAIVAWAKPVLAAFRKTYQEVSPSGTGIKIISQGKLPGTEHRWRLGDDPKAYIEWFDRAKYTTLTGHRLDDAGVDAVDCQAEVDALYRACFPPKTERAPVTPSAMAEVNLDDDAILQKARNSRDGPKFIQLFDSGNASLYNNDDSAADIALCGMLAFWFGNDPDRIDRVFRRSALMRDKWADRADYRKGTIDKVLSGRTDFYTPRAPRRLTVVDANESAPAPARKTKWMAVELLAADLPEPNWAVPDLLPEGLAILAGRPKKGKSLLALSIAIAVAGATPALGHFDVDDAGDALFVALEDFERRLQDRLGDMLGKRGAPPTLAIWTSCPRIGEGFKEEIEAWLITHPRARLIVLDTYQRVRPTPKGAEKNTYAVDYEDAALLQRIAIQFRVCMLLIQHTRKPTAGSDPFDEIMGTTGNAAAADALMVLQTISGRADAKLHVIGRDLAESEHAMSQDPATGQWLRIGNVADVRRSGQREAILAAIRVAGEAGLAPRDIAQATKQRSANVRYLLYRMRNDGEVAERDGRYFERDVHDVHIVENAANTPNALTRPDSMRDFGGQSVRGAVSALASDHTNGQINEQNVSPVSPVRGVSDVSPVRGVSDVSPVRGVSESWRCACGADVVGHLAHCPVCGQRRSP